MQSVWMIDSKSNSCLKYSGLKLRYLEFFYDLHYSEGAIFLLYLLKKFWQIWPLWEDEFIHRSSPTFFLSSSFLSWSYSSSWEACIGIAQHTRENAPYSPDIFQGLSQWTYPKSRRRHCTLIHQLPKVSLKFKADSLLYSYKF